MSLKLYGTVTSPYVRRVRVVATELGVDYQLIDTASESGQAELRAVTPIWKVPAALLDGKAVLDSHIIIDQLLLRHGSGALAPPRDPLESLNTVSVIDGALDALINTFYLAKDGVATGQVAYTQKQRARAACALQWLEERVVDAQLTSTPGFGIPEIALATALDWMAFRDAYDIEQHPRLCAIRAHHSTRPSLAQTQPPAS